MLTHEIFPPMISMLWNVARLARLYTISILGERFVPLSFITISISITTIFSNSIKRPSSSEEFNFHRQTRHQQTEQAIISRAYSYISAH